MPRVDEMFPKPHISAADLKGRAYQVTIQALNQQMLWDQAAGEEWNKWILLFEEASKYFILNKTNAEAIAEILGSEEANAWIGAQIVIFPTQVQAFGEVVDAVRVRAIAEQSPLHDSENDPAAHAHSPRETSNERGEKGTAFA